MAIAAHIYGWTWEDPAVDVEKLQIQDGDSILCITSAGDNVLHYAIKAQVEVHSVDMNPSVGSDGRRPVTVSKTVSKNAAAKAIS
jgi:S-adenosylmethionine:diacylglycerol 3-amino-3-carboxypropyl transferase